MRRQTNETNLFAVLFERKCLVKVERIGVNNRALAIVDPEPLVDLLGPRSKGKRVTRVLAQCAPTAGAFCITGKVLFFITREN